MALMDHNDDGRVEKVIEAARRRISMGMSDEDVQADLVSRGITLDQAFLALAAAKILIADEK